MLPLRFSYIKHVIFGYYPGSIFILSNNSNNDAQILHQKCLNIMSELRYCINSIKIHPLQNLDRYHKVNIHISNLQCSEIIEELFRYQK